MSFGRVFRCGLFGRVFQYGHFNIVSKHFLSLQKSCGFPNSCALILMDMHLGMPDGGGNMEFATVQYCVGSELARGKHRGLMGLAEGCYGVAEGCHEVGTG